MSALTPYYTGSYKKNNEEDFWMDSDNVLLGSTFNPISNRSTFSTADAKANASFRRQLDEESNNYGRMDISELLELRNKALSDLNKSFERVYANVGLHTESVKLASKILKEKKADREVIFKHHAKDLFFRGSGNVENTFSSLSEEDQHTVLNWIDRFKFAYKYFLIDLLYFITTNPDKIEICKSYLDVQDPKKGIEDRLNSLGNYMNMFSGSPSAIRGGTYTCYSIVQQ